MKNKIPRFSFDLEVKMNNWPTLPNKKTRITCYKIKRLILSSGIQDGQLAYELWLRNKVFQV